MIAVDNLFSSIQGLQFSALGAFQTQFAMHLFDMTNKFGSRVKRTFGMSALLPTANKRANFLRLCKRKLKKKKKTRRV